MLPPKLAPELVILVAGVVATVERERAGVTGAVFFPQLETKNSPAKMTEQK
jgi:hypothetical protein